MDLLEVIGKASGLKAGDDQSGNATTETPRLKELKRAGSSTYQALIQYSENKTRSLEIARPELLAGLKEFRSSNLLLLASGNPRPSREDLSRFLAAYILAGSRYSNNQIGMEEILEEAMRIEISRQRRSEPPQTPQAVYWDETSRGSPKRLLAPLAIVVAMRSYPYGGGESYIIESCKWLQEMGHRVILVNTKEKDWSNINTDAIGIVEGVTRIGLAEMDTDSKIVEAIEKIILIANPDYIHCQGEVNAIIMANIKPWWPPVACGFHFWNGLIDLHRGCNIDILANIESHSISSLFTRAIRLPNFMPYIVSKFMSSALKELGSDIEIPILAPIRAQTTKAVADPMRTHKKGYILQLNCSLLKGGRTFLEAAENLSEHRFMGFCATEGEFEELCLWATRNISSARIEEDRLYVGEKATVTCEYVVNVEMLYEEACIVLVPSLVDETFSRVVAEAVFAGIPVLGSANGNIPNLLPRRYCIDQKSDKQWARKIRSLMLSQSAWEAAAKEQQEYLSKSFTCGMESFKEFISNAIVPRTFQKNVVILCPWSEQGLGYHARVYAKALSLVGIRPHIFSFQPYAAVNIGYSIQTSSEEWAGYNVHYSLNTREELSCHELVQFCRINHAKVMLCPEVCWEANWQRLQECSRSMLDIAIIPNPETLRLREINRHNDFPYILATTRHCERLLKENGIDKVQYIGHAVDEMPNHELKATKSEMLANAERIKLLHIAGYNHKRKMTNEIISATASLASLAPSIELVVISQVPFSEESLEIGLGAPNISLISKDMTRDEILSYIDNASYTLQLSTHEGLGLGFYESLSRGVPVITLNTPPHNEHIIDGLTGYLLTGESFTLYDNDDSLVHGMRFSKEHYTLLIQSLRPATARSMSMNCFDYVETHLSPQRMGKILGESLGLSIH